MACQCLECQLEREDRGDPFLNDLTEEDFKMEKAREYDHVVRLDGLTAFVFSVMDLGHRITISGWDSQRKKYKNGDLLLLVDRGMETRYKVESVSFPDDPPDQYFLHCSFNPRPVPSK